MSEDKKAFVVISFTPEYQNVYDSAIQPAIQANNLIAQKADGKDKALRIINDDIVEKIEQAEIIIIDVSNVEDNDGNNIDLSNIYFELGLAMARIKRCIVLTQDAKNLVFDLKSYGVLEYDKNNHKKLKADLTKKIEKALNEKPVNIFKNINNGNDIVEEFDKKTLSTDLILLNNLYRIIGESNVSFNIFEISDVMRKNLRKLFASEKDLIEIKFYTLEKESIRHIRITENGLNYLASNN